MALSFAVPDVADVAPAQTSWDEPHGVAPRGVLVLLTGRGETARTYERFGRRISSDGYRVRVVRTDPDDLEATRREVVAQFSLTRHVAPKVLVGADYGATLAAAIALALNVDGVVLAGLAAPRSSHARIFSWDAEMAARTACPSHRKVLDDDPEFVRRQLDQPLPAALDEVELRPLDVPTLVIHGCDDSRTTTEQAFGPFFDSVTTRCLLVPEGRHDVLNDSQHRSVAASLVLFLESLRLGSSLPAVVQSFESIR